MKKISAKIIFLCLIFNSLACAQYLSFDETPAIGPSTPTGKDQNEGIVFEARPIVKYQIYDQLFDRLLNSDNDSSLFIPRAFLAFDPQLRMLTDNSVPVRMPSYRIFISTSATKIFGDKHHPWSIGSLILDHGHFSNGQDGCTFGNSADNDSACKEIYKDLGKVDLDANLNRRSGEFSTDFIRLKAKLMWIDKMADTRIRDAYEFTVGYTRLVNWWFGFDVGGYKELDTHYYPMNQFYLEIAKHHYFENGKQLRFGAELFYKPSDNDQVFPINTAVFGTYYLANTLGFFIKGEYGQDAYNIRLVDKLTRASVGFVWSPVAYEPTWIEFPR